VDSLYLNRVAQNVIPLDDAIRAFGELDASSRAEAMSCLYVMAHQSHPSPEEVSLAIAQSGLKPTYTPCRMLSAGPVEHQLSRIAKLPDYELDKAFLLLVAVFRIADNRRRNNCGDECHHWWHQDLSCDSVVDEHQDGHNV